MSSKFGTTSRTIIFDRNLIGADRKEVLKDRAKVLNTISTQLDKVEHPTEAVNKLQHRVTTLWRELHDLGDDGSQQYPEKIDKEIKEAVTRFNELQTNTASTSTTSTPAPTEEREPTVPPEETAETEPEDDTTSPDNSVKQPPTSDADAIAASILSGLRPLLASDRDGNTVKAASADDLETTNQNLQQVSDRVAALESGEFVTDDARHPLRWGVGAIIGAPFAAVLYVICGAIFGWTAIILPCLGIGLVMALIGAWLAPTKNNDQPRG